MTAEEVLARLETMGDLADARRAAAYHKSQRRHLGVRNPVLNDMAKGFRNELDVDQRLELADGLWRTNVHEARILAAKTLTQARIRPSDFATWSLIASWVPEFDGWAIADHACDGGQRRLIADPRRLDEVEAWTTSDNKWMRRAALVMTLPWTKQNHPSADELAIRERVLGWAALFVPDRDHYIQKAIAWWLRDLSKHDPERTLAFLEAHGDALTGFARTEAARNLV